MSEEVKGQTMAPKITKTKREQPEQIVSSKWQIWMDNIRLNNADGMQAILESCNSKEANTLLNGRFDYLDSNLSKTLRLYHPARTYYTYPVTIAASYGAVDVLTLLIENGADPLICESGGNNIFHTLIDVSCASPKSESRMAEIYRELTRRLSLGVQRKLLSMENSYDLRPIEYAAGKGCVLMLRSILETKDVYLKYEMDVGLDKYKWYDVTEYETPSRLAKCPLLLLAMSEQATFVKEEFAEFMQSNVIRQWRRAKIRTSIPLLLVWFLVRLTFTVNHITLALDQLWLNSRVAAAGDGDPGSSSNANGSLGFCEGTQTIQLSASTRTALLYYGIVHSACIIVYDIAELMTMVRKTPHRIPRERLCERFIFLTHLAYRINQFLMAGGVIALYVLYLTGHGDRSSTIRSMLELFTVFSVYISMAFFVLVVPYVGFQLIIVHQLISQLFAFLVLYMLMLLPFSTFFMAFMNANSEQGCIEQFRDPLSSIYTSILLMLNMVDLTEFMTIQRGFLLLVHVLFVFIIGILMINFLIAIMTNKAGTLMERQHILMDVYAMYLAILLEIRLSAFASDCYSKLKKKDLLYEGGRYYVIDIDRLVGCTKAEVHEKDPKPNDV